MTETQILLVRHPETEANINGRFVGRGDSPFTREGRRQLARVPRKIAAFHPDTIWSSPLDRTRRLAEKTARLLTLEPVFDDRLLELDFGEAEGMTFEEITSAGMAFNYRNHGEAVAPGGESREALKARTVSVMNEIVSAGGRHAVVTHGGVFRASLAHLMGLADDRIWSFHVHNAQLASVRVIDGHGMLEEYVKG